MRGKSFVGMGRGLHQPDTSLPGWERRRFSYNPRWLAEAVEGRIAEEGHACKSPLTFIECPFIILLRTRAKIASLEPQCFVFAGGKFCFHGGFRGEKGPLGVDFAGPTERLGRGGMSEGDDSKDGGGGQVGRKCE